MINLYQLYFSSSHFLSQPNKKVFHPSTFPPFQPNTNEGKLNLFYHPTFPSSHNFLFSHFSILPTIRTLNIIGQKCSFPYLYYYLRGFPYLDSSFFQLKNALTPLCLSRDKIKGQSGKNSTLTPIKTLPKQQNHSPINFQIDLFTYKLNFQNKNYIYNLKKKKAQFFSYKIGPLTKFRLITIALFTICLSSKIQAPFGSS